jgi:ferredoxin
MSHTVHVEGTGVSLCCRSGQSVLGALGEAGLSAITVGCRGGGCGVCRVHVLSGSYEAGCMSQAQISDADRQLGIVLACKVFPKSDMYLRPLGRKAMEKMAGDNSRSRIG